MKKDISFWLALLPLIIMITAMAVTIVGLEGDPHIPLMIGTAVAALIAIKAGFKWKDIEESMYKGIKLALPAVVIIILVGLTIGAWIGGGIVATMVFYGLKIMSPSFFLVSICVICAAVSLSIGSSWSTMATIGVAGMGIGLSMGIPAAMVAGAVISGAYFGDKLSPLSDTTNLAAGLTGTDLFEHIKFMLVSTIPAFLISLIVYWFLGRNEVERNTASFADIERTMASLQENFVISPWLLIVPLAVIVLVMFKVPAIPALVVGIVLGFFSQIYVQGDALSIAVSTLQNGYVIDTGNHMIDELFNGGGIEAMMYTVSLTIVAMTFGGILENTGMLQAIVQQILKLAKTAKRLIITTVLSSFATNVSCSEQYISIVVPARMYAKSYEDQQLHSKNLSRAVEDGGTLTSVFVPWNTCGVFIFATLGVHAFQYAPYAILNFTVPLLSIILTLLGKSIIYRHPNKTTARLKQTEKAI
ncbi:Na+/H+ antiporter NhaC [Shouchella clausii]|uniref:Na+/H+ antiporter NhaC n=1 Tax=Shouchella clausii TaxID=79880 RepID=A0A268RXC9_SHOCL|nr:Na+/H+ antiporter NhaC [Shouchella clausii]PAD41026.1 Na+/H+ antiporter NhaC [Bacillus sp. 7520-S]SPU18408.1 NahC family Na(+)/H(+) antiporter [Niallia circulans]MBU8598607.1 Na+/H+ antiporter NhaC [Shouchella clausii]MCM3550923.1 Na+/H+ antiporter NhaC [Shouchella clausii]MCY1106640.1 Na+/H+ antiporter NhaC [Shouchella clausii]